MSGDEPHERPAQDARRGDRRRGRLWIAQVVLGLLGALVLAVLVRRSGLAAIAGVLAAVRPGWLAVFAAIELAIFVGYAVRWRWLLRALGEDEPLGRLLGVRLAGLTVGSLTPGAKLGGEPLRAFMIAQDGVRAGRAVATVVVDRGIELLANIVFGVAYCGLFALRDAPTAGRVLAIIGGSGLALAGGLAVILRRLGRGESLLPARFAAAIERLGGTREAVDDTHEALRELLIRDRRVVTSAFGAALVIDALIFAEYATLFAAFGAWPTAPELAGTMLGVGFAHALPIPASLGALEGAQAAMMRVAGGSAHLALVAATVARLRDIAWTLPGAVYLGAAAFRRRARRASRGVTSPAEPPVKR